MRSAHHRLLTVLAPALGLALSFALTAPASAGVTKQCENAVVAHCVKVTCPTFCSGLKGAAVAACKKACTPKDRCALRVFGSRDKAGNGAVDAQNRNHLMACVRENRPTPVRAAAKPRPRPVVKTAKLKARKPKQGKAVAARKARIKVHAKHTAKPWRKRAKPRKMKAASLKTGWKKARARSFARRHKAAGKIRQRKLKLRRAPKVKATIKKTRGWKAKPVKKGKRPLKRRPLKRRPTKKGR